MTKRKSLLMLTGIFITATVVAILTSGAQGVKGVASDSPEVRADVIIIDVLKNFRDLEQPPVVFLHDLHTNALVEQNKDCASCHLSEKDLQSPKFKRLTDTSRQEVMDTYHNDCMQCHQEMQTAGVKAGPVEKCGECHHGKPEVVSERQLIVFDKSLHYRHTERAEDKCERCHHQYNEVTKQLFYEKGKEGACVYCHKQQIEENRISIKQASHLSCIACHRKTLAENKEVAPDEDSREKIAGPIQCSGCHAEQKLRLIKRVKDAPGMKRNQPDVALIQPAKIDLDNPNLAPIVVMNPVPFDHKTHQEHNDTCIVCHHASLDRTCSECHTLEGAKDGKFVKLEQAMHQIDSEQSCFGCHTTKQQKPSCAGCHSLLAKGRKQEAAFCAQCHMEPPQASIDANLEPEAMASMLLRSRTSNTYTYSDEDIPEAVTIKDLEKQYEPVYFPHRKIVRKLLAETKDDKLAQYFHRQKGTVCQACHHNSPAAKKPPRCYSCHGKPFDAKEPLRPGMKGAYHQQCFGCHKQMGIKKPDPLNCMECHQEKKKQVATK